MSEMTPELPNPSASGPVRDAPKLKRETIVMVNDRGRLGLLVALCSLAGVAVGFGLSSMATGLYTHHCSARMGPVAMQQAVGAYAETPPWLGVRITTHDDGGARVEWVERNSPARASGIQRGDVIVGFARTGCPKHLTTVDTSDELVRLVRSAEVGERVLLKLRRDGDWVSLRSELQHMPPTLYQRELRRWR